MNMIEQYNALMTIVRKEVGRCLRIWMQIFVPPVITMTLYYCIFGKVVGHFVPSNVTHGVPYIQFISPGLIMMSVLMSSFINTSSSFFGAKFSRCVEEMMVSPMSGTVIIFGYLSGGLFRGMIVGALVLVVSLLFTHLQIYNWLAFFYTIISTSLLFSLIGLLNGIFAKKFDDVAWIPSFVITPLTYLGGVFYSVSQLPAIWRTVSMFNPIHYIIKSFRFSMLGIGGEHVVTSLIFISLFNVLFFFINLYLLNNSRGMRD
jgi:ABC-2 type transport system permease protein